MIYQEIISDSGKNGDGKKAVVNRPEKLLPFLFLFFSGTDYYRIQ